MTTLANSMTLPMTCTGYVKAREEWRSPLQKTSVSYAHILYGIQHPEAKYFPSPFYAMKITPDTGNVVYFQGLSTLQKKCVLNSG